MPIMVSGEGRSGTTAMARALRAGGVRMIYPEDAAHAEDSGFTAAWHRKDKNALVAWITEHEGKDWWGAKVPGASTIATWPGMRDIWPGDWIIMTRDPLARMAYGEPLPSLVSGYLSTIGSATRLNLSKAGVALVSYEKLALAPKAVFTALGLPIDIEAAAAEIIPADPRYHIENSAS